MNPKVGWVSFVNSPIVSAGPSGIQDADPSAQPISGGDGFGDTPVIAPQHPNGEQVVVGSTQILDLTEAMWLFYGDALAIAHDIDPTGMNSSTAACASDSAVGWEVVINAMSGSVFHENMHVFIGKYFEGRAAVRSFSFLFQFMHVVGPAHADFAYEAVLSKTDFMTRTALSILVTMLVVVILGGILVMFPALLAVNRQKNYILSRFLGLPRPILQVEKCCFIASVVRGLKDAHYHSSTVSFAGLVVAIERVCKAVEAPDCLEQRR